MRATTAILLLTALLAANRPAGAQGVGTPAPDFTYTTFRGETISLSDYRGKVVFIFFFGNTCPYCLAVGGRTETEINTVFAPTGKFQAIGLDLWDSSSSVASVSSFQQRTGITYPLCLKAGSAASLFATTYDRLMVIDADGIIRYKGASNVATTLDQARSVIEDLVMSISTSAESEAPPAAFTLSQNYPNPFNPTTSISYTLPAAARVRLTVYDVLGHEVCTLVDGYAPAGRGSVDWDGTDDAGRPVPSGVYLYRLRVGDRSSVRVMTLVR